MKNTKDYVSLHVYFSKVNENDKKGIIEITSNGYPCDFTFSTVDDMNFLAEQEVTEDMPNLLLLGKELREVILKHFGDVNPTNLNERN